MPYTIDEDENRKNQQDIHDNIHNSDYAGYLEWNAPNEVARLKNIENIKRANHEERIKKRNPRGDDDYYSGTI